jgi:hypothetical protein
MRLERALIILRFGRGRGIRVYKANGGSERGRLSYEYLDEIPNATV